MIKAVTGDDPVTAVVPVVQTDLHLSLESKPPDPGSLERVGFVLRLQTARGEFVPWGDVSALPLVMTFSSELSCFLVF